ncbi:extracellular solute-binding protein [Paenibacillus sacheonensis]|uniref:Extracellular solute-binding protein n=1 Tax=Paenibacillus sacheonensis TaxID=742054 RepID=A0A7X4YPH6_9BACL|nr:extracellular solute-binding protein [Paenibacillus sacheonensis]MBM7565147.1 putative aldouronate transport system substrate-binding protein [Paenibacillus sacheonensis]NBC70073.1 extracellular solute-binding protein [Paenibacillus sacheonensis]
MYIVFLGGAGKMEFNRFRGSYAFGFLAILALVPLIGCASQTGQLADAMPDRPASDGPVAPYAEPVTMTVWAGMNDVMRFASGESIDDNLHTRFMKSFLNLDFQNKWVADGGKIAEKIDLDISSNDLPDAVQVNVEQLSRLIKNGQLEDLTPVWNRYALPGLKENMGYQDRIAFTPAMKSGRIYGIPLPSDMGNSVALMYIRKDWLLALHREVPRTTAELDELVHAFALQDPDRNGKKDTWGVAFEQAAESGSGGLPGGMTTDALAAGFGAYPELWLNAPDGQLAYGSIDDRMIPVLSMLKDWYDSGAIDPEFAFKDLNRVSKDIADGRIGIVFGPFHYPLWPLKDTVKNNPNADWIVAPIPTADGKPAVPKALPFTGSWVVVRSGYEHPEALIKALNVTYMMQADMGEPGKFWSEAGMGIYKDLSAHLYMKPYLFDSPFRNMQSGKEIQAALRTGDEAKLASSAARSIYANLIQSKDKLEAWTFRKIFDESERVLSDYPKLQYSAFFDAPTPEMLAKGEALARLEREQMLQIIMGEPVDRFRQFRESWLQLGGAAITREVNAWRQSQ